MLPTFHKILIKREEQPFTPEFQRRKPVALAYDIRWRRRTHLFAAPPAAPKAVEQHNLLETMDGNQTVHRFGNPSGPSPMLASKLGRE